MKRILSSMIVLGLVLGYTPAEADWRDAYKWEVFLWETDGVDKTKLRIGTSDKATDGYDAIYEEYAYLAGYMRAYFYHPEWGRRFYGGSDYYTGDIRATSLPQSWNFYILASRTGRDVTISWNLRHLEADGCTDIELSLTDLANGQTVVMTETTEDLNGRVSLVNTDYSYYNGSRAPHAFTVTATEVAAQTADAPAGLRANPGAGRIVLHWDADTTVLGYRVYRAEDGGALELQTGEELLTDDDGDGTVAYVDKSATRVKGNRGGSATYTYAVTAVAEGGCESKEATIDVSR